MMSEFLHYLMELLITSRGMRKLVIYIVWLHKVGYGYKG